MKIKYLLLAFIFAYLFLPNNISAECTYQDKANLNESAGKVKSNYEANVIKKEVEIQDPDEEDGVMMTVEQEDISFTIKLYNITEDVFVKQSSDIDNEDKDIYFSDTENGIYSFTTTDYENIIKYTFTVYGNKENCSSDALKTINLTKPRINPFYYYSLCSGLEDKVTYCKQFVDEDVIVSENDLLEAVNKYQKTTEEEDLSNGNKVVEFIKDNYIYILIGVGIVTGAATTIYVVRRRSSL